MRYARVEGVVSGRAAISSCRLDDLQAMKSATRIGRQQIGRASTG